MEIPMNVMLSLILLVTLTSCASKNQNRDIKAKAEASTVSDSKALGTTIHDLINNSKTLTASQKTELQDLLAVNKKRAEELTEKSYQFRSIMIKELLSGKVKQNNIRLIKNNIKKIEAAKLKNTFDTVEKITAIVAAHPDNAQFAEHLIQIERPATTR
jgi:hypothetical protein